MYNEQIIKEILKLFNSLNSIDQTQVMNSLKQKGIPVSAFNTSLSGLEALCKYLKENENKSIKEISKILNRSTSTIYTTYRRAHKKLKEKQEVLDTSVIIPYGIFKNRKYSISESLVAYLKKDYSIKQIASMLNRDYKTISTFYRRYKIKNGRKK